MPAELTISVIIVNYNTGELLARLVDQLAVIDIEQIIVVDNASDDQSLLVLNKYPQLQVICNVKNRGFGYACNQGVALSDTDAILLLNPDCELSEQAFERLVDSMCQHNRLGLCSPLVLDSQGHEQSGSRRHLPTPRKILQAYFGQTDALDLRGLEKPKSMLKMPATSGACMLIRRVAWDQAGGMDAGYFLHFEDLDLMYQMQQVGWEVWLQPDAQVTHIGGYSSQNRRVLVSWYKHKSLLRYLRKHHATSILTWTVIPLLTGLHFIITAPLLFIRSR